MSFKNALHVFCDGEEITCPKSGEPWTEFDPWLMDFSRAAIRGALVQRGWSIAMTSDYCPSCSALRFGDDYLGPSPPIDPYAAPKKG